MYTVVTVGCFTNQRLDADSFRVGSKSTIVSWKTRTSEAVTRENAATANASVRSNSLENFKFVGPWCCVSDVAYHIRIAYFCSDKTVETQFQFHLWRLLIRSFAYWILNSEKNRCKQCCRDCTVVNVFSDSGAAFYL